jgi:hypothetical protein
MPEPILEPTSPAADPEASKKLFPGYATEEKILSLKIKGAAGGKFKRFVEKMKQEARIANVEFIHAEIKSARKEPPTMNVTNLDPNKIPDKGYEGPAGPKVLKKDKPGTKMSPEELEKMGYSPEKFGDTTPEIDAKRKEYIKRIEKMAADKGGREADAD